MELEQRGIANVGVAGRMIRGPYASLIALLVSLCLYTESAATDGSTKNEVGNGNTDEVESPKAEVAPTNSYFPLDIGVSLNGKYVGQINSKIDPRSNAGLVQSERLLSMLKPLLGKQAFDRLENAFIEAKEFVSFEIISAAGLVAEFDNLSLTLVITTAGDDVGTKSFSFYSKRNAPNPDMYPEAANFTAGINMTASQVLETRDGVQERQDPQITLNGLMNFGGFGGITVEGGGRYSKQNKDEWRRTPIIASKDFYGSALRLQAGEITPKIKGFQGSRRMLGLGLFRSYSAIRPFQTVRPTGRSEFSLDEESTIEVYVNEELVETLDLSTGAYSLNDFPITSRANDVRLEIVSRSGNQQTLEFDVYGGNELLSPGVTEYGFFLGKRQLDKQFDFANDLSGTGYYRRGITGQLSLGATAQITDLAQQAGLLLTYGNRLGIFELEAAQSRRDIDGEMGNAFRLDYRKDFSLFSANDFKVSANAERRSEYFQNAFESILIAPLKWTARMQANWTGLNGVGATFGLTSTELRGSIKNRVDTYSMMFSKVIGSLTFSGSIGLTESTIEESKERFNLTVAYRPKSTLSSSARYDSSQKQTTLDVRRRAKQIVGGFDGGIKYQTGERGERLRLNGDYSHNRFDSAVQHTYSPKGDGNEESIGRTQFRVSSFIGMSGSHVGVGRPVRSGFVLAPRHRSLRESNIEIKSGEQFVARPGFLGAAVIPLDRPYTVSRFDLIVDPLPIGYDLGQGEIIVFPGHGNSFRLPIGSDASRTAMGFLYDAKGPMELVSGTVIQIDGNTKKEKIERPVFTNRGGRFVADRLSSGSYQIIIGAEVIGTFDVSEDSEGLVNVGKIVRGEQR